MKTEKEKNLDFTDSLLTEFNIPEDQKGLFIEQVIKLTKELSKKNKLKKVPIENHVKSFENDQGYYNLIFKIKKLISENFHIKNDVIKYKFNHDVRVKNSLLYNVRYLQYYYDIGKEFNSNIIKSIEQELNLSKEDVEGIKYFLSKGIEVSEIEKTYGISKNNINNIRALVLYENHSSEYNDLIKIIKKQSVLNKKQVSSIKSAILAGEKYQYIAKKFSINKTVISTIKSCESYSNYGKQYNCKLSILYYLGKAKVIKVKNCIVLNWYIDYFANKKLMNFNFRDDQYYTVYTDNKLYIIDSARKVLKIENDIYISELLRSRGITDKDKLHIANTAKHPVNRLCYNLINNKRITNCTNIK